MLVLTAATLWATYGLLLQRLTVFYGISPLMAVQARVLVSVAILVVALALWRPALLRIRWGDVPFFALMGLVTVAVFFIVYAYAITLTGVSVAVVLQYTAPAFVTVIAWRLFREPLQHTKLVALALAFLGCVLVAGVYGPSGKDLHAAGVLFGLASGLTFGLYTIFNKRAVRLYSPWTVITYNLGFGLIFLMLISPPAGLIGTMAHPTTAALLLVMAVGPTIGAHGLYVSGLAHIEASTASILSTWEPALATILAFLLLGETLDGLQLVGAGAVIAGVIVLSRQGT